MNTIIISVDHLRAMLKDSSILKERYDAAHAEWQIGSEKEMRPFHECIGNMTWAREQREKPLTQQGKNLLKRYGDRELWRSITLMHFTPAYLPYMPHDLLNLLATAEVEHAEMVNDCPHSIQLYKQELGRAVESVH